jgi:hypothetical protein
MTLLIGFNEGLLSTNDQPSYRRAVLQGGLVYTEDSSKDPKRQNPQRFYLVVSPSL